jgi:hypothetical protein
MANKVYDPETEGQQAGQGYQPGPGHDKPSGKKYDPRQDGAQADPSDPRGNMQSGLQNAEHDASGLYNPSGDGKDKKGKSAEDLRNAEENSSEDNQGGLYTPGESKRRFKSKGSGVRNKRNWLIGGFIVGGFTSIFIFLFSILPLKTHFIMENLQNRFFSSSEQASKTLVRKMFTSYVVEHVIPDYKNCGTTINRACKVSITSTAANPVTNMYRAWSQERLENKLATDFGIEVRYNQHSHSWHLKTPGVRGDGENLGPNGEKLDEVFSRTSKRDVRDQIDTAIADKTRWKRLYYRYKVGALLEHKYGIKRCIIFCGIRKAVAGHIEERKQVAKLYLAERVLKPRSELTFIAMTCILKPECTPEKVEYHPCQDGDTDCIPSVPTSRTEDEQRELLKKLAQSYGVNDIDRLVDIHRDISEGGFQEYMIRQGLLKVFSAQTTDKIVKKIPIIGWVNLAVELRSGAENASPKLRKLGYVTAAASAASIYALYSTQADESHTGEVEALEGGSFSESLDRGVDDPNDPLVGGTASASETPLYEEIMGTSVPVAGSMFSSILGNASAAANNNDTDYPNYKCKDGNAVPKGKLVCKEEEMGQGNGAANLVSEYYNSPGQKQIGYIADAWQASIGKVINFTEGLLAGPLSFAGNAIQSGLNAQCSINPIPSVYCVAKDKLEEHAPAIIKGFTNYLIPNAWGSNMGGGRTFNLLAAGADTAGKDACGELGCRDVDGPTAFNIIKQQENDRQRAFARRPIYERMFSTDTSESLVAQVALATPSNVSIAARDGMATILSNPIASIGRGFGGMFSSRQAYASQGDPDYFRTGNKAFPENEIPNNPEKYWDEHNCGDMSDAGPIPRWQKKAADDANNGRVNPLTGMPIHEKSEPCLLIKSSTGVAGGMFDKSLLTKDDLSSINANDVGDTTGDSTTTGSLPNGNAKELATKLLTYIENGKISCTSSKACPDIAKTAKGQSIKNSACYVDALDKSLLGMLLNLAEAGHSFILSALCTDHPSNPKSAHHQGKAVDFNTIDDVFIGPNDVPWTTEKIKVGKELDRDIASFMPKSTGFGQSQCHPAFPFLKDFETFSDACHHQHVEVQK